MTLDIDANGIVNVNARDKATGKEQQITIQSLLAACPTETSNDGERCGDVCLQGQGEEGEPEAKNTADNLVYSSEKSLDEHKDKLPQAVVDEINSAITDLRTVARRKNRGHQRKGGCLAEGCDEDRRGALQAGGRRRSWRVL